MTGDAEMQPVEGVDALDDLVDALDPTEAQEQEDAPEAEEPDEEGKEEGEEEEEEAPEGEEEGEDEPTFTIKHDGKEVTLKQSELIELGQMGFDYSKKTMAVAEERKAVETERTQAETYRKQYEDSLNDSISRISAFSEFMQAQLGQEPPVSLAAENAGYYLAEKKLYDDRKGQLQQAQAAIEHLKAEQSRQRQDWIARQAGETERALRDTLPGWNDGTLDDLAGYLRTVGLTPDTLTNEGFVQKGVWELAHKAKAYDAIQAKKAEMKPKEKLARVVKPSAVNTSASATARAKREADFNKNPSVDALANLFR